MPVLQLTPVPVPVYFLHFKDKFAIVYTSQFLPHLTNFAVLLHGQTIDTIYRKCFLQKEVQEKNKIDTGTSTATGEKRLKNETLYPRKEQINSRVYSVRVPVLKVIICY
jgi:hypothetical protein